jgi:hypothetical protein
VFEAWTSLAALARETSRIRLGQWVTGNGYRNPALQTKMAPSGSVPAGTRTLRLRCPDLLPIVDAGDEALRVEVVVLVDPGLDVGLGGPAGVVVDHDLG